MFKASIMDKERYIKYKNNVYNNKTYYSETRSDTIEQKRNENITNDTEENNNKQQFTILKTRYRGRYAERMEDGRLGKKLKTSV